MKNVTPPDQVPERIKLSRKERERLAAEMLRQQQAEQQTTTPDALPRGAKWYFTLNEWRLLAGLEVNGKKGLRFDLYLGVGPLMVRLSL